MKTDLLIVGGTAAGTAAAAAARKQAPRARILLVESGPDVAYSTCEMPMYVGRDIARDSELTRYTPDSFAEHFSVDVRAGVTVTGIDPSKREATTTDGVVTFDRLILATGARAHTTRALEEPARNLHVLRTLDHARHIRSHLDEGSIHHAVIVGGGYIGLEVAHALMGSDMRVTLVQPGGHVVASGIHIGLARLVTERMKSAGVDVRHARVIGADRAPDGSILALKTDDGEKIGCQFVLSGTGIVPHAGLALDMGLKLSEHGAIQVTDQMRTSRPGVWACGDVVDVPDAVTGGSVWAPLAMNAFRTGRVAGTNAVMTLGTASQPVRLPGVVPTYAVHCFGLDIAHAGMTLENAIKAGFQARAVDMTGASHARLLGGEDVHLRLVYCRASGRVLGCESVGPAGSGLRVNTVSALIRLRATVDDLEASDTVYHPLLAPMHDPLKVAARLAQKDREER